MSDSETKALDIITGSPLLKSVATLAVMRERRKFYERGLLGVVEIPQSILDDIDEYSIEVIENTLER